MPSPERDGEPPSPEQSNHLEHEPEPYLRVARFGSEATALRVYQQTQDAILRTPCDVSVYRFLLNEVSHVAAIGIPPPEPLAQRLDRLLAAGEPVTLPADILTALLERRRQATQIGPWVEGHYRPGRRLDPGGRTSDL